MLARLSSTFEHAILHDNRLDTRNTAGGFQLVAHLFQSLFGFRGEAVLQIQRLRFPLLMKARQIDGILRIQKIVTDPSLHEFQLAAFYLRDVQQVGDEVMQLLYLHMGTLQIILHLYMDRACFLQR